MVALIRAGKVCITAGVVKIHVQLLVLRRCFVTGQGSIGQRCHDPGGMLYVCACLNAQGSER